MIKGVKWTTTFWIHTLPFRPVGAQLAHLPWHQQHCDVKAVLMYPLGGVVRVLGPVMPRYTQSSSCSSVARCDPCTACAPGCTDDAGGVQPSYQALQGAIWVPGPR